MNITRYSCQILMKLEFSTQIFEKISNTKFYENSSRASRVVPCGRTDRQRHDEATSRFSQLCERAYQEPLTMCLHISTSYQPKELLLFLRTVTLVIRLNFVPGNGSDSKTSDSGTVFHMILHMKNSTFTTHPKTPKQFPYIPLQTHKHPQNSPTMILFL